MANDWLKGVRVIEPKKVVQAQSAPLPAPVVVPQHDPAALVAAKEASAKADAALQLAQGYTTLTNALTEAVSKLNREQVKKIRITPKRNESGLAMYYDVEVG